MKLKKLLRQKKRPMTKSYSVEQEVGQSESPQESIRLSDESSESMGEIQDSDIRNAELVIDRHHNDPFEVMRIQTYDDTPMARSKDDVVIRIEASTVSSMDCKIRDGTFEWKFGQKPSFPIVPGVDCVGIVTSCGKEAESVGIAPGDRVASFLYHGCNAKYRLLNYRDLVRVPNEVDAFEAVAIIRTYTAAFQALMQGILGHQRYSRKPLLNKRILIVGPCGTFERALVDLSIFLGAKRVFFSAHSSTHSHDMYIRLLGAKPLSDDPDEWPEELEGSIDIAVDSICEDHYRHTYNTLGEKGILVATGMMEIEENGNDFISNVERVWVNTTVAINNQCTFYDGFAHQWHKDKKQSMKDMIYLFNLLEKRKIKPKIATKIPLLKVPAAQETLDQNLESMERRGIIVVDPWLIPSME